MTLQPEQESNNSTRSVVAHWFRLSVLITINIVVLGMFAAYFKNESLSLLDVVGVVSNSIGIVTGLLGIWFFFLSESLNRTTSANLEKTTATVNDLRDQMWEMIQKTFTSFLRTEDRDSAIEAQQAIETLESLSQSDSSGSINADLQLAIDAIRNRIDVLEKQKNTSNIVSRMSISKNDGKALYIDTKPFLHEAGSVHILDFDSYFSIADLLDDIWYRSSPRIPSFTYGSQWVLRNPDNGMIFDFIKSARNSRDSRDARSLTSLGIVPRMLLEVIPYPTSSS